MFHETTGKEWERGIFVVEACFGGKSATTVTL